MARPRRDLWTALRSGARWMRNPVSERGATESFRVLLSLARPEMFALAEAARCHPTGRRLLAERPDLGATLNDMARLKRCPTGSFGRRYFEFMSHPDTVPGYLLAGLAYKDGTFDALDWDEETKWVVDRVFQTHDATHVLGGYGADIVGEGLNIYFSLGAAAPSLGFRKAALTPFGALVASMRPTIGWRRWWGLLREALERGAATGRHQPFSCIDWEGLLEWPLEAMRKELGVPPLAEPGMPTARWSETWLLRRLADGYGASDASQARLQAYRAAVEAGIPVRELMRCDEATRDRIAERAAAGAPLAELRRQLA